MSRPDDIKRLINNYTRRLQKLEESHALTGISADPSVLIQIEDIKARIAELEEELALLSTPESQEVKTSSSGTPTPPPSSSTDGSKPADSPTRPKPSWLLSLPLPRPIRQSSQISAVLRYPLFSSHQAELELEFLFGEAGCFWSGHPVYDIISTSRNPQVILAPEGGGKTACAYALSQIGDVDGPSARTLPCLPPRKDLTVRNTQKHIVSQMLNYIYTNPNALLKLNQEEQRFLIRLLIEDSGVDLVRLRLSRLFEQDHSLATIFRESSGEFEGSVAARPAPSVPGRKARKYSRTNEAAWLQQARQCLDLLGFDQCLVVLDFERLDQRRVNSWLRILPSWANHALIVKLFLPEDPGIERPQALYRYDPLRLSWSDDQLLEMARWRFNSLARLANIRFSLESIFDDNLSGQFIRHAKGNPGRLARLWRYLYDDHLTRYPDQLTFSEQNLNRAVEKLNDPRYS